MSASAVAKFRSTTERVVDYDAPARLARVLYRLYQDFGVRGDGRVELGIPITQPELASIIGASEAAVQMALAALRRRGILITGYRTNAIVSFAELADAAEIPADERAIADFHTNP